jgi:hypothetical protein
MPRLSANASPSWAVARLVEQVADVAHRFRRNAELALEGVDFLALHRAVAFGELGRQHDNAYGEELVAAVQHRGEAGRVDAGLLAQLLAKVGHGTGIGRMTERRANHSAHWAAHGEARHAADDLAPVAHAAMVTRRGKERRFHGEGLAEPRRGGLPREPTVLRATHTVNRDERALVRAEPTLNAPRDRREGLLPPRLIERY